MRALTRAVLLVNAVGAIHAARTGKCARWLGLRFPGTATQHALTVGSGLSAPPLMLGAMAVSARRGQIDRVGGLSALMIAGILGEPNTWRALREPAADPLNTACVLLEITLPAVLVGRSIAIRRSDPAH